MSKRESERIPSNVAIIVPCHNTFYSGTVRNLSGKGMYINVEVCFPIDLRLEVILRVKNDTLKVPVEIVRVVKSGDNYEGMGVKLLNVQEKYIELLIKNSIGSLS